MKMVVMLVYTTNLVACHRINRYTSPKNKKERILEPLLWRAGEFQDLWWYHYHGYRIKVSVRTQ